jgi:hypothetical protein
MKAYKLMKKISSPEGVSYQSLYIGKPKRYKKRTWYTAEVNPTKGFSLRKGFHCSAKPSAPHIKPKENLVWVKVKIKNHYPFERPDSQGGLWYIAQRMKILKEVSSYET